MEERSIIFSSEMVRAILDDYKTQTRRVIKPQPPNNKWKDDYGYLHIPDLITRCPYGQAGDRLWVRETFNDDTGVILYKADCKLPSDLKKIPWKSSIFMPRWASRITLEITEVRVERLQEITDRDTIAEGVLSELLPYPNPYGIEKIRWNIGGKEVAEWDITPIGQFKSYWDSLNAKRGYPWSSNPWVWRLQFKLV